MIEVKIAKYRCKDKEEVKKLESMLPILKRYARLWNIPISVDQPHGEAQKPIDDQYLHIHFFSFPFSEEDGFPLNFRILESAFGYDLPHENLRSAPLTLTNLIGNDVAAAFFVRRNGKIIESPENDVMARILPGNIYILFDIAHSAWDGRNEVLEQILEEAIPMALEGKAPWSDPMVMKTAQARVTRMRRARFLARKPRIKENFIDFCARPLIEEFSDTETALVSQRIDHDTAYEALAETHFEEEVARGTLADFRAQAKPREEDYAREFEMILRIADIRGVRVTKERVVVYTGKIYMDGIYYLGTWEISIPHNEEPPINRNSIYFTPVDKEIQRYKHSYAENKNNICFGDGAQNRPDLNQEIDKLFQEGDIFTILHWCIAFLKEDEQTRNKIKAEIAQDEIRLGFSEKQKAIAERKREYKKALNNIEGHIRKDLKDLNKEYSPFYASIEDREKEKEKYIKAMRWLKEKIVEERLKAKINECEKTVQDALEKATVARQELKELLLKKKYLEQQILSSREWLGREFGRLAAQAVEIRIVRHMNEETVIREYCQILFKDANRDPVRFWLVRDKPSHTSLWARGWKLSSSDVDSAGNIHLTKELEKLIVPLLRSGELAKAALLLRDLII